MKDESTTPQLRDAHFICAAGIDARHVDAR
jgi:hypothetical protein